MQARLEFGHRSSAGACAPYNARQASESNL